MRSNKEERIWVEMGFEATVPGFGLIDENCGTSERYKMKHRE